MTGELRYGIVGCAGVGGSHARAVNAADGASLVACCDIDGEEAKKFADEYDLGATYTDIGQMIEESDIDAVSVCTPSGTHADVVEDVATAGAHVLCEKPLDVYAERINRMISACEDAGVTLAGVFQRRFDPLNRAAKAVIEEGNLGDPVLGDVHVKWFRPQAYYDSAGWRGTRDMDGGCMMNQGIHDIDRLQWLVGDVESVMAYTDTLDRDLDCEDTAAVALRFENGALGTIEATTAVKGGTDHLSVNGTEGSLAIRDGDINCVVGTGEESRYSAETETLELEGRPHPCGENHEGVVQDFVSALDEGREPEVPATAAREAVDIILAAYRSSDTGEPVYLDDLRSE